ncbi:tRNA (adenosine(37)-N6)-threonylcarbamoyltransferase complex dimerization subunit type 1 TsaB [Phreatobacter sp.]|uniref:tRNA (adenosine(37)-N6)-threonylcarbamoyltransferase complex dimerization subunit type 1 TsaB n=1 Tax=Phreatobacter sp. TaxID=1966341 RepID=UPI003F71DF09
MLVLALDTALAAASVAVLDTDRDLILAEASEPMERGHAERLLPLVAEVCGRAGVAPSACRRFVAATGPGSFTGIRVAVSAARGLALATGGEAVGIPTLVALATPHLRTPEAAAVLAAIDARHGHVYASLTDADGAERMAPRYLPAGEAARHAVAAGPCRLVGSGADAVFGAWPEAVSAPVVVDAAPWLSIAVLARLGAAADPATSPCRPLYLKAVDAKPSAYRPIGAGPLP